MLVRVLALTFSGLLLGGAGCKGCGKPNTAIQQLEHRTKESPMIVAHRGGRNLGPENTLAAIDATMKAGLDVVELDLSITLDKQPVLIHVVDLTKATDAKTVFPGRDAYDVRSFSAAELQKLHVQPWSKATHNLAPQRVAFFPEAMKRLGKSALVIVDNKTATPAQMVHALRAAHTIANVIVQSTRPEFLAAVRQLEPRLVTAALGNTKMTQGRLQGLKRAGVGVLHWHLRALSRKAVAAFQRDGFFVGAYAVSNVAQMKKAATMGVDFITTDFPVIALEAKAAGHLSFPPERRAHIDAAARRAFVARPVSRLPADAGPSAGEVSQ